MEWEAGLSSVQNRATRRRWKELSSEAATVSAKARAAQAAATMLSGWLRQKRLRARSEIIAASGQLNLSHSDLVGLTDTVADSPVVSRASVRLALERGLGPALGGAGCDIWRFRGLLGP